MTVLPTPGSTTRRSAAPVLVAGVGVAVLSVSLAGLGMSAVYAAAGVLAVTVAAVAVSGHLGGSARRAWAARTAAARQARAGRAGSGRVVPAVSRHRAPGRPGALLFWTAVGSSAALSVVLGLAGPRALAGAAAVAVLGGLGWLAWPLVVTRIHVPRIRARAFTSGRRSQVVGLVGAAATAGAGAWAAAGLGRMTVVAVVGALVLVAALAVLPDRHSVLTFAAAASLVAMLHKSFGPQDLQLSGGAVAVYVTTTDLIVGALWLLWWREGTIRADLAAGLRDPVVLAPLAGGLFFLPSLLAAPSTTHAVAELTRMAWMALLYVYLAVRVRSRRQIGAALLGMVVFTATQLVVVLLQWRTGGVLGLSFLGVPTELGDRVTDFTVLGRPFGTIIHPVFLGAALGCIAVLAVAVLLVLRRPVWRFTAGSVVVAALVGIWLAQARAAFVSVVVVGVAVLVLGVRRGQVRVRSLARLGALGALAALPFVPWILDKVSANVGTGHFFTEIRSRLEINEIAERMFLDAPLFGVGLNNFEVVLPAYEQHPVIFFGHPVHNLYLLYLSETGLVGMVGFAVVGAGVLAAAVRLARSPDRFLGGLGVGGVAVLAFFAVEELLGFSLRQDVPLALFWMVAGLVAAGLRLAPRLAEGDRVAAARHALGASDAAAHRGAVRGWRTGRAAGATGHTRTAHGRVDRRWLWRAAVSTVALLVLVMAVPSGPAIAEQGTGAMGLDPATGVVFSAVDRSDGGHGIYLARADGTQVRRISPADGRSYSWPRWAFGNTRIVHTVRNGPPGAPESIAMMRPDGTDRQVLATFDFQVGQPVVERDGRSLVFTATAPWFPHVAIFRMDLATTESRNLTARTVSIGGFDADPALTDDGRIVLAWTAQSGSTRIAEFAADGTDRRVLVSDGTFNTDPAISADGRLVAVASYRGPGTPSQGDGDLGRVKTSDWHIAVRPRAGGDERVLTSGADCTARGFGRPPCQVTEMSGVLPRFAPDGSVTFNGALDSRRTCICAIRPDGTDPRVLLASTDLAIDWHDWPQRPGASTTLGHVGSQVAGSRVIAVLSQPDGTTRLVSATPDLMHRTELPLPAGLQPLSARWGADRSSVLFTAKVPVGTPRAPHPAAPQGSSRRAHVTLDDLSLPAMASRQQRLQALPTDLAQEQVFLRAPDGTVRQLTDPWLEDWQDGLAPGDVRGNTAPSPTPDGRAVVVTNTSRLTGESFLLHVDLADGSVRSLTNGTAGALPTDDADPAVSPDGRRVAFAWTEGHLRGIYLMDATTGEAVSAVTADSSAAGQPAWSATGASLAYSAQVAGGSRIMRVAVAADGTAGPARQVSGDSTRAWSPLFAPEGTRLLWLQPAGTVIGLYAALDSGEVLPVQPDPLHNVFSVDWR